MSFMTLVSFREGRGEWTLDNIEDTSEGSL